MARIYTVEVPDYIDGKMCVSEETIDRPITEEAEETLRIGQLIRVTIEPKFSVRCKVSDISETHVRLTVMLM